MKVLLQFTEEERKTFGGAAWLTAEGLVAEMQFTNEVRPVYGSFTRAVAFAAMPSKVELKLVLTDWELRIDVPPDFSKPQNTPRSIEMMQRMKRKISLDGV